MCSAVLGVFCWCQWDPFDTLLSSSKFLLIFLLIVYFWMCWVFTATWRSPVVESEGYSSFAVCGLLIAVASPAVHRLNSCGAQSWSLRGMWDLFRSGIKPMSPALASGFLTSEPPGKPYKFCFKRRVEVSGCSYRFVFFSFQVCC